LVVARLAGRAGRRAGGFVLDADFLAFNAAGFDLGSNNGVMTS